VHPTGPGVAADAGHVCNHLPLVARRAVALHGAVPVRAVEAAARVDGAAQLCGTHVAPAAVHGGDLGTRVPTCLGPGLGEGLELLGRVEVLDRRVAADDVEDFVHGDHRVVRQTVLERLVLVLTHGLRVCGQRAELEHQAGVGGHGHQAQADRGQQLREVRRPHVGQEVYPLDHRVTRVVLRVDD
ncbi:hypothetical protein EGW08_003461, partial [Elysia chlorotica]